MVEEITENLNNMLKTSSVKNPYSMLGVILQQNAWLNCSPETEK